MSTRNWNPDPDFYRPQPHPYQEPRRPLYREPEPNYRRPSYRDPEPIHRSPDPDFYRPQPHPYQEPRRPLYRDTEPTYRRPDLVLEDRYAPTFYGDLNPRVYSDWEGKMDWYFEGQCMSDERKYQVAKGRLRREASLYWTRVEHASHRWGETPIRTWSEMKIRLREKYLPRSYRQEESIIHQAPLERTNVPFYHQRLPIPTIPIEYKDKLREEIDMSRPNLVDQDAILIEPVLEEPLEEGSSESTGDCEGEVENPEPNDEIEEVVYEDGFRLADEYEGEEFEECDTENIGSLPEETIESHPLVGPSSEIQEICENQVPLVQYPQEELNHVEPIRTIIPYPLETVISQAPIENLCTELSMSSHPMVDPFRRMTESNHLRLALVPCPTPKVSPVTPVEHFFLEGINSPSPVGVLLMAPDPFLRITDLPFLRVYFSSPVGQIPSFEVIIHSPFLESFSKPFLEGLDRYLPRKQTLTVAITCPRLLLESFSDPFLGVANYSFRKVYQLIPIGHHLNLQGTTFSPRVSQDSTSYFLSFPRSANIFYTIQVNFVVVFRVNHLSEPIRFATYFWKTLWHLLDTHDKFSCACHPPIQGKT